MRRLWVVAVLAVSGCFASPQMVRHPDAPMLILEGKGSVAVAVYDRSRNEMVAVGEVDVKDLVGWTVHRYDWEQWIEKQRGN